MTILDEAIPISRECTWVGRHDPEAALQCNAYLLMDGDHAVVFDCGSLPDFPVVMRKIIDCISPHQILAVVASHHDPDVCGSLAVFEDIVGRDDFQIVAHSRTLRLLSHLGLRGAPYAVDEHDLRWTFPSGRELRFVPTPYLHAPGAIVTHDPTSGAMFTGDLFGAFFPSDWTLVADERHPDAMKAWHQAYMPSGAILRPALNRLAALAPVRLLPQHGSVLEGPKIAEAFAYLGALPCGVDLEPAEDP
ncbi:MAG: MBL fold metallo-hydrolase [Sandaracinaceae bacterium]|nr:MBL fold metallo-hydrolase [Sandaracinaceae bacterium]